MKKITILLIGILCLFELGKVNGQAKALLTEGFENITFPPVGWTSNNVLGTTSFWIRATGTPHAGLAYARVNAEPLASGGEDWLVTPKLTVGAITDSLSFWIRQSATSSNPDTLYLLVSTTDNQISSFTATLAIYIGNIDYATTTWQKKIVSLSAYTGQNIYIAFKHVDQNGRGVRMDDVAGPSVYQAPNDLAVISLTAPHKGTLLQGMLPLRAIVRNMGIASQPAGQTITFKNSSNIIGTSTTAIALATNEVDTVILSWNANTTSISHLTAEVASDDDISNNIAAQTAFVYDADYVIESFEGTWPPANWATTTWTQGINTAIAFEATRYANLGTATNARLITPKLNVTTGDSIAFYAYASGSLNLKVQYSADNIIWTTIDSIFLSTAYVRYVTHINTTGHFFYAFTGTVTGGGAPFERLDLIAMPPLYALNNDLATTSLIVPQKGTLLQGTHTLKAVIKNIGVNTQIAGQIVTLKNGSTILGTTATTLSLATGAIDTVSFIWNANVTSTYHLKADVAIDDDSTNNLASAIAYVYDADYNIESFEGLTTTTFPPTGWSAPGTTPVWGLGATAGAAYEGVLYSGCVSGGTNVQLITPKLSVAAGDSIAYYSYSAAATNNPTVTIEYSTDGITWNTLTTAITLTTSYTRYISNITTAGDYFFAFSTTNSSGSSTRIDLIAYPPKFVIQYDAGVLGFAAPTLTGSCSFTNAEPISVKIKNYGAQPISNFLVSYNINGGTAIQETVTNTIAPLDTFTYTFSATADFSAINTYAIKAYTELTGDASIANDSAFFTVTQVTVSDVPYLMGFEVTESFGGWSTHDGNADNAIWTNTVSTIGSAHTGTHYERCNFYTPGNDGDDWLVTKCINLIPGHNYILSFYYRARNTGMPQSMTVFIGDQPIPANFSTMLVDLNSFTSQTYSLSSTPFTVTTAGTYYFGFHGYSVSGANSAIYLDDISITECDLAVNNNVTDVTCNGGNDGDATITLSGGTSPFTISWSNGGTTANNPNLTAGTYIATVHDVNNCVATDTVIIAEPSAISILLTKTDITCNGSNDGSITADVSGGIPTYTLIWDDGSSNNSINGLSPGWYYLSVTDNNNCLKIDSTEIIEPALIATTTNQANVLCNGTSTGNIDLTVTGGTFPYSFIWDNGEITQNISNLPAGTYIVVVTDVNNCTNQQTIIISEPITIAASGVITSASCGVSDGGVLLTVNGGISPYSFAWSNNSSNQDLVNAPVGFYFVTVTDQNNCTDITSYTIDNPNAPVFDLVSSTDVLCSGGSTGAVDVIVTGGSGNYTFLWSNGTLTQNISGVVAGDYTVTVTDGSNCASATLASVLSPTQVSPFSTVTDVTCHGANDGTASVNPSGGVSPYTISWTGGASTATITNLAAGNYDVTITDSHSCSVYDLVTISEPSTITPTVNKTNVSCFGGSDGSISLTASGGTPSYTYCWSNGATTSDISGLTAGLYSGTITDVNGCTFSGAISISQPATMLNIILTPTPDNGSCNGTIVASASGGTFMYSFIWNTVPAQATPTAQNLCGGAIYTITVTDANGCTQTDSASVTLVGISTISNNLISIYPNPTQGSIVINNAENTSIYFYSITGELLIKTENLVPNRIIDMSEYANGNYIIRIVSGKENYTNRIILQK